MDPFNPSPMDSSNPSPMGSSTPRLDSFNPFPDFEDSLIPSTMASLNPFFDPLPLNTPMSIYQLPYTLDTPMSYNEASPTSYYQLPLGPHPSYYQAAPQAGNSSNASVWTYEENKIFENTLASESHLSTSQLFAKMASRLPGKTYDQIKNHYEALLEDVRKIEGDEVPLPDYEEEPTDDESDSDSVEILTEDPKGSSSGRRTTPTPPQRRRGKPWTEEEHRLFLEGMEKYGRGDWRSIARHFVKTKSATQVASHAQKYFRRLKCATPPAKRRYSIHDTRMINSSIVEAPARFTDVVPVGNAMLPIVGPAPNLQLPAAAPPPGPSWNMGGSYAGDRSCYSGLRNYYPPVAGMINAMGHGQVNSLAPPPASSSEPTSEYPEVNMTSAGAGSSSAPSTSSSMFDQSNAAGSFGFW